MAEPKKQPRQNCILFLCLSFICLCLAAISLCGYNMILQRQLSNSLMKLQSRMEIVETNFTRKDGQKEENLGPNAANRKVNEEFSKEIERRLHAYETACRVATNELQKRVSVLEANLNSSTNLHQVFVNESVFKVCEEAKEAGMNYSGRVKLILPNKSKIDAYCDMVTDGGGWIIFQKRADSTVSFERDWKAYEQGFGDVNGNHWMGLSALHSLTSTGRWTLRVDLKLSNGEKGFAKYTNFKIGSKNTKYKLMYEKFSSGNIGDSLPSSRGMQFTTVDSDNDYWPANNCALHYKGAWWHNRCFSANLNNWYYGTKKPGSSIKSRIMSWWTWKKAYGNVTFSEMKIKIGG